MSDETKPKRKKGTSPTQRSLQLLRKAGAIACVVEQWVRIPGSFGIRRDAFNFGDILCSNPISRTITLVQTSTAGHQSDRKAKILASEEARIWMQSGGEIEIHGWSKKGPRGCAKRWTCSVTRIKVEDFPAVEAIHEAEPDVDLSFFEEEEAILK